MSIPISQESAGVWLKNHKPPLKVWLLPRERLQALREKARPVGLKGRRQRWDHRLTIDEMMVTYRLSRRTATYIASMPWEVTAFWETDRQHHERVGENMLIRAHLATRVGPEMV
jgi:hypothetical protein